MFGEETGPQRLRLKSADWIHENLPTSTPIGAGLSLQLQERYLGQAMSASGNQNNPQNSVADATSRATLDFCNEFAEHIKSAYPEDLSLDTWRAVLGPHLPEPSDLDVEPVPLLVLVPNVAAQAHFSTLTHDAPSPCLLP